MSAGAGRAKLVVEMLKSLALLLAAAPVWAQVGGLPPEWELRKQLTVIAENAGRFQPVLEKIDVATWKNAPSGYAGQLDRVRTELGYLVSTVQSLAKQPERLTLALDAYFRMDSVDQMLRSLEVGIRKYQNPAVADLLQDLMSQGATDREQLRQYIVELAADREIQFRAADEEAQRCRASLSRQPRPQPARAKEQPR